MIQISKQCVNYQECCPVTQSCQTLCHPVDCNTLGLRPSLSPEVCPSSCPLHWWCHPAISSSDSLFFYPQCFPASGTFPVSWLFASVTKIPKLQRQSSNDYSGLIAFKIDWFDLLAVQGLSGTFSNTTVWRHLFFGILPFLWSSSHNCTWPLGRTSPWLYRPLLAEWYLSFSTHSLGMS